MFCCYDISSEDQLDALFTFLFRTQDDGVVPNLDVTMSLAMAIKCSDLPFA